MLDFLGIGAQKAGTTWLYRTLSMHPDVIFPAGKEVHFWDNMRGRGIKWYADLFQDAESHIQGEITPSYAILSRNRIADIRRTYPDIRIIYILRNPIERAWSSALMGLYRAEMILDEASDNWFIDHFRSRGSLWRGDYQQCISNWLCFYPEDQFGLFFFETLSNEPLNLVYDLCDFLHISPQPLVDQGSDILSSKVRPVPNAPTEVIRPSLLPILRELYYPKIQALEVYLDKTLNHWLI